LTTTDDTVRFCTIANAAHYPGLVAMVNSLRLQGHREPVTVFDLGLTDHQRRELGAECDLATPQGDARHPWLVTPKVLRTAPAGVTVYVDADMIVTTRFDRIVERARAGALCVFPDRFEDRRFAEWVDLFGLSASPRPQPYVNAGFLALDTGRFAGFLERWETICEAMADRPIRVATLDLDDPLTWPDQDALNALLMTEVAPDAVAVQPVDTVAQGPWELATARVDDVRTLRCTRDGHALTLLHSWGAPKPWQTAARTKLPRTAYLTCLRRLLVGDDVTIRTTEELAPWLRRGPLGAAALRLETTRTALRTRTRRA
jgi:hypothetical protein